MPREAGRLSAALPLCPSSSKYNPSVSSLALCRPLGCIPWLWEGLGHCTQGSRQANIRSSLLLSSAEYISPGLIPTSTAHHLLWLPFVTPISSRSHRSFPSDFLHPTHCFIPVPYFTRHSLGTRRPVWSEKQVSCLQLFISPFFPPHPPFS